MGSVAGLMLAAGPCLPGCLQSNDGNPPRGSIAAPRGKQGARTGRRDLSQDFSGAETGTTAGTWKPGGRPGQG
jgi:hypothetical protein